MPDKRARIHLGIHTPERHAVDLIYGVTASSAGVEKRWIGGREKERREKKNGAADSILMVL